MEISKTYHPQEFENRIYDFWCKNRYFEAQPDAEKIPFTIVMPPPNITGILHIGHALNNTIQDVVIRFKRMQGYNALWVPGTDHASIATEVKIVEKMQEEGLDKETIGREGFLERAWKWKAEYGGTILNQLKRMGFSCDWSKEAFTMDAPRSRAVKHVFVKLYKKGKIYRGSRIINWCPSCKTALSDAEVEYEEQQSHLWHIRYPLEDGTGAITVATTRPETMLGDTAVAVNPDDVRYRALIGKMLILPLTGRKIPVVADAYVDAEFGSGAVKITPAHDPNDYEVGLRHDLPVMRVMNDDGTMAENAAAYKGLDRYEARKKIVEDLKASGYLEKIEAHTHNVGACYRCRSTVEPIVSKQWFMEMKSLAAPAIKAVRDKKIELIPERFEKVYYNWMENIKDWCISRQLWWGHRIPAYYCEACGEVVVEEDAPEVCPACGHTHFHQDEDVLDTWFSSALWPFSTLGYPDKTPELEYFYPNNLLVTAYDIIFFWVARMIFSGIEHMEDIPFSEVLFNGIIRDAEGRKMSKSLGNGIDPLALIDQFGADSVRLSLSMGVAPGSDSRYSEKKTESARNFINKLWNASRFILMNSEGVAVKKLGSFRFSPADRWILSRLNQITAEVTANLSKYELGLASSKLYDFVWSEFCDWYIELAKPHLYGGNADKKSNTVSVLIFVMDQILKLLHPFIPFVTEEIYQALPGHGESIMVSDWPTVQKKYRFVQEGKQFGQVMEIIRAIRNLKAEMNVPPSKSVRIFMAAKDVSQIKKAAVYIEKLANVSEIEFISAKDEMEDERISALILSAGEIYVPLGELIDFEKEIGRLKKEYENLQKEIARADAMLKNKGFTEGAPAHLVEKERVKLAGYRERAGAVAARIKSFGGALE